ncbi:unnamed protein product [Protopolystoma xenopodis]|uniref:Fibronectin type-III domain-containing protein n=1 Tax=Protopolystoma xenopodis TaxID=117903 RepID=A0A3S4ZB34_9PLAT|nr:unnamed protein product [Protopolystoma xenopodis]
MIQLPNPPTDLEVRSVGGTFAVLRWRPSTSQRIDSYTLSVDAAPGNKTNSLRRLQLADIQPRPDIERAGFVVYNVTDLEPFRVYRAWVHAASKVIGLSLPSDPCEFRTAEIGEKSGCTRRSSCLLAGA